MTELPIPPQKRQRLEASALYPPVLLPPPIKTPRLDSSSRSSAMRKPDIGDLTRVWDIHVHWTRHSQCGVWDPRYKMVSIFECIKDRASFYFQNQVLLLK